MKSIKSIPDYNKAQMLHKSGHDVLANLFLRAAYGVK